MNQFQKNPFQNNSKTKIVGYNKIMDEKTKIQNIKENMMKLKYTKPTQKEKITETNLNHNQKVDILKNLDRFR